MGSAAFNAGIPALGTWVLYAFIVSAALAFGLGIIAGTSPRPAASRWLRATRMAALGTCALVTLDVLLLLYAFMSHDFRIRYVMRYSDRSMPIQYLIASLWGGQDGSLLWWTFLLAGYSTACILWLRTRHRELAPYVISTLMGVVLFFGILMAFAANPFSTNVAGAPPDGEGLNPALQNFYMAIHPPSLYTGFVGCAVPFAFGVAALLTGKLDDEWIRAARKWALFAWMFLSIGNTLGMLWAYEELGWGGFWAWDPVENAACIPWWTCTAFLHSVMIQERRGTLKVWNVSLIMLTFVLTIFGTFLTRSGLISSIHSFAQSEVGIYFVYFMAFVIALAVALIAYRYPKLKTEMEIESQLSREAMFVYNNWMLLGICVFIVVATLWPKLAEWLFKDRVTVGASFYNFWLPLPGAVLLALMAIGTLTPWRKGTPKLLWRSFAIPLVVGGVVATLHVLFGRRIGHPAYVPIDPIYPSATGRIVAKIDSALPPVLWSLVALNLAAIVQEYVRGVRARMHAKSESAPIALVRLVSRNRRRYGGYIVHVGFALMVIGWAGMYWRVESEASLRPGESMTMSPYRLRYEHVETHRDPNHREIGVRMTVWRHDEPYASIRPARFIYTTHPESPTTEVSISPNWHDDLYVVMAAVNPSTHVAHIKAFINPFTDWIWFGCLILILGVTVAMWPELRTELVPSRASSDPDAGDGPRISSAVATARTRQGAAIIVALAIGTGIASYATGARAQGHVVSQTTQVGAGSDTNTPEERRMFDRMRCMCGDCAREPLSTCACDFAVTTRAVMRDRLRSGMSADEIVRRYVERWGSGALTVPPDQGHNRAVWAVPLGVGALGAGLVTLLISRWRNRGNRRAVVATESAGEATVADEYERRLDEELRGLDD